MNGEQAVIQASNQDVLGAMTLMAEAEKWLSAKDAAKYLGMAVQTLYNHRTAGTGPPSYTLRGGPLRYKRDDLDAWMLSEGKLGQKKYQSEIELSKLAQAERALKREEDFMLRLERQRQKVEDARRRRDDLRKQIIAKEKSA